MVFNVRNCFSRWAPALTCLVLTFGVVAPASAQFFPFPWDQPARRPLEEGRISPQMARGILAREGAKMIGAPRARGAEIIVIGQDSEGQRQRFTLDAVSGEVLEVINIGPSARRQRLDEERRRENVESLTPPREPLPPPVHPADEGPNGAPSPAPSAEKADAAPPPAASARTPAVKPDQATQKPDSADDALSPIKPMRPAGAPKVEPLPQ